MKKLSPKKCKGINKAHGFKGCGIETLNRKFGLCPGCLWDWMLNDERGKIYKAKVFNPKVKKSVEKEKKVKDKEWIEQNKTITQLINEARLPFQKFIRTRDANKPCISCGTTTSDIWDAGHFKKAELYTGLIFDERNCFKQCRKCNSYLNGNEGEYRKNLMKIYGSEWLDKLDSDADKLRTYKFTRDELKNIKEKYRKEIKTFDIN